ncbi:S-locus-specific glycoprotein S6 [Vitis vinifera]|uniref:S-locus-specific glycoprotein S6 n=1 Tax=Vitis vinifera TaxID=29760 RepID=A0A438D3U8_VITVI|nr:S-locus-specific glycoprotein S6 [Vitis vinifera]
MESIIKLSDGGVPEDQIVGIPVSSSSNTFPPPPFALVLPAPPPPESFQNISLKLNIYLTVRHRRVVSPSTYYHGPGQVLSRVSCAAPPFLHEPPPPPPQPLLKADSIRIDQPICDGESLVSSSQSFELGFFSPDSSKNRYLGIWYKNTPRTVVWVANRNNPIADLYGVLTIFNNGALVLLNQSKSVIWSPNLSKSFDDPSDTMLPNMKVGWNLKTGLQQKLTSWKSVDDPSPGDFSYRIDIDVLPYMVLGVGAGKKVRPGPWNGLEFNGLNALDNSVYKAVFVANNDEVYALYESNNNKIISRLTLNHSGFLQRLNWQAADL